MIDLIQRDPLVHGHHEQLPHVVDPIELERVDDLPLLLEELLHELREPEPELVVGVAVDLEDKGVTEDRFCDLAAAREAQLLVELASVIEAEDPLRLTGEEIAAAGEEAEMGVASEDGLEVGDSVGSGLDRSGTGGWLGLAPLTEGFRRLCLEEGGGEWGGEEEEGAVRIRVRVRVRIFQGCGEVREEEEPPAHGSSDRLTFGFLAHGGGEEEADPLLF